MWPWNKPIQKPATSATTNTSPDKEKRRSRSHFEGKRKSKHGVEDPEHPLNFYLQSGQFPANMSSSTASPRDSINGGVPVGASADKMETTPAPEFEATENGTVNGNVNGQEQEQRPTPPPHRTKSSPPPPPEIRPEEAEAFKASGNKFYKAGQYGKAIDEYTKGWLQSVTIYFPHFG